VFELDLSPGAGVWVKTDHLGLVFGVTGHLGLVFGLDWSSGAVV
jgi:hypothetical protein